MPDDTIDTPADDLNSGDGAEEPTSASEDVSPEPSGEVKKASFATLTPEQKNAAPINIDFLMDIALDLSIELGRAILSFKDILALKDGAVVELNKLAGDPVDIFVNSKLVARGEVVVIDDNFGVRVTDILSPAELLNNLRK